MTDYVLEISSYAGILPGARHHRGRVKGPNPESCHGNRSFNAPEARGKWSCAEGHVLPEQVEWDVDAEWTEARYQRWAAKDFEGDGPGQFLDTATLIKAAVARFRGEVPRQWWEDEPAAGQPGDRLYLGYIARTPDEMDEETGREEGTPPWGSVLAEIKEEAAKS